MRALGSESHRVRHRVGALVTIGVLVLALWYTVWPPRTEQGYRGQAHQTVAKFRSEVATAWLWGREVAADRTFSTTASVGLAEMEADATGNLDQFSAYQPPSDLRPLRADVVTLGDDVVSSLAALRIAARDGNADEVVALAGQLDGLLDHIDRVERESAR